MKRPLSLRNRVWFSPRLPFRYRDHLSLSGGSLPRTDPSSALRDTYGLPDIVLTTLPLNGTDPYLDLVHPDDLESLAALIDLLSLADLSDAHAIVRVRDEDGGWTLPSIGPARSGPCRPAPNRCDCARAATARQDRTDPTGGRFCATGTRPSPCSTPDPPDPSRHRSPR